MILINVLGVPYIVSNLDWVQVDEGESEHQRPQQLHGAAGQNIDIDRSTNLPDIRLQCRFVIPDIRQYINT